MNLPKHINLTIEHQPHAVYYHWYPDTPVGFHGVCAATLERALALALEVGK